MPLWNVFWALADGDLARLADRLEVPDLDLSPSTFRRYILSGRPNERGRGGFSFVGSDSELTGFCGTP